MLKWSLVFFVISIIAAFFGFGGIAETTSGIAQVLFFLFLAAFVVTLVMGLWVGKKATNTLSHGT